MKSVIQGQRNAKYLLVQAVDDHDASFLDKEYQLIREYTGREDVMLAAFQVEDWNSDLSPWEAPPVFGSEPFGDGATKTLSYIEQTFLPDVRKQHVADVQDIRCIIGGYSLSALFALWASYQTDSFHACAAASPSVWFPGWAEYAASHDTQTKHIYLSLGDKEEKTKNPVMRTVADCIRRQYDLLMENHIDTILEWNPGNHFKDADVRTAKAFAWCVEQLCAADTM